VKAWRQPQNRKYITYRNAAGEVKKHDAEKKETSRNNGAENIVPKMESLKDMKEICRNIRNQVREKANQLLRFTSRECDKT